MRITWFAILVFIVLGCRTRPDMPAKPLSWYDPALGKRDKFWGYRVGVEVSDPGCRIELNGEHITTLTNTVGEIILWGHSDGKFRGKQVVRIVANPVKPGQSQQSKNFFNINERERIPRNIYFDLNLEPVKPTEKLDVRVR